MRATRFRMRAGLLSWEKKDGTEAKNQRILSLIPAQYQRLNSTEGWRDFNKEEIALVKAGALQKPQQGRKRRRAVSEEPGEDGRLDDDNEEDLEQDKDSSNNTLSKGQTGESPENHPEDTGNFLPLQ